MGDATIIILAAFHVSPQTLHIGTVWCYGTAAILVRAFGRMMQQKQSLLFVPNADFPLWVVPVVRYYTTRGRRASLTLVV